MNKIDTKCSSCKFNKLCKYANDMRDCKESINEWILKHNPNDSGSPIRVVLNCDYYEKREEPIVKTNLNLPQTEKVVSDSIDKLEDRIIW